MKKVLIDYSLILAVVVAILALGGYLSHPDHLRGRWQLKAQPGITLKIVAVRGAWPWQWGKPHVDVVTFYGNGQPLLNGVTQPLPFGTLTNYYTRE